jgi:hypothetical protein
MGCSGGYSVKTVFPQIGGVGVVGCTPSGICVGPYINPGESIGITGSMPLPFCFSPDTKMTILENNQEYKKNVSEIKIGDFAQTFNGKEKIYTKIIENTKNKGVFEFYEIKVKDENLNIKKITVTGNHTMIVFGNDKEIKFKFACELKIGDLLRTNNGLFEIYEINHEMKYDSYKLLSEKGTILANDILVSTIYLEGKNNVKECKRLIDSIKIPIEIKN